MDRLPGEIVWHISISVPHLKDVVAFLSISQDFSQLLDNDIFWREIGLAHSPRLNTSPDELATKADILGTWKLAVRWAAVRSANILITNIQDDFDEYLVKGLVVGDSGVGKTCLIHRYFNDDFPPNPSCMGVDFYCKMYEFSDCELMTKFFCWDTAGQERFGSIVASYFRGQSLLLLCFDVTRRETFESARNHWLDNAVSSIDGVSNCKCLNVCVVGCKMDLAESRQVSEEEARVFAAENGWPYFETSSKTGSGVDEFFEHAVEMTIRKLQRYNKMLPHREEEDPLGLENQQEQQQGSVDSKKCSVF